MAEQTLILGAENHLVATLAPANTQGAAPPFVALLTNSGVIPRSGPHRMNVHLARRFAAMGIPSIRFDMSGLGDSRRSGSGQPLMTQWVSDTRAVMDLAQSHFGCDRFFMIGFCSGAEVAHLVGLEDTRLSAALLWELYAYPTAESKLRKLAYRLRRAGVKKLALKAISRLQKIVSRAKPASPLVAAQSSQAPPRDEFAKRIQTLVDRGVELMFSFSDGQPEWFNHRGQFKGMFGRYAFFDKVSFSMLKNCDHLVTRREAQEAFSDMTVRWVKDRVLPSQKPASALPR